MADINDNNFTVKEIVLDIRTEVRGLATRLDRIDREGSIGTKSEIADQENRIRSLEKGQSRLSGVWATISIIGAILVGATGLVLGALAYIGG